MNLEHFTKLQVKHYSTDPENVGSPETQYAYTAIR